MIGRAFNIAGWLAALSLAALWQASPWLTVQPAAARDAALGLWMTQKKDAKIRVSDCGGQLCGTIAWLAEPIDPATGKPETDKYNPDPTRRSRPLIGVRIFGMAPVSPSKWTGPIYNADDGRTYGGSVELLGPNSLKIEGCLGPFCSHEIWARTN